MTFAQAMLQSAILATAAYAGIEITAWLLKRGRAKTPRRPSCRCLCPGCSEDLVSRAKNRDDAAVHEVVYWYDESMLVHYACTCSVESCWDFGPPVPILLWALDRDEKTEYV